MAAANHADVMRAVANNFAFSAQDGILQCHRIQTSAGGKRVINIRWVHSRLLAQALQRNILPTLPGMRMAHLGHPRFALTSVSDQSFSSRMVLLPNAPRAPLFAVTRFGDELRRATILRDPGPVCRPDRYYPDKTTRYSAGFVFRTFVLAWPAFLTWMKLKR
jgi:hypothetical protein